MAVKRQEERMVMAYFPFFIEIEKEKGLIVGGGNIAVHKAEKLLPFGPQLTVIAPRISSILKENPAVTCLEREFCDTDVEDCRFVIAASDDAGLNRHISKLCREKGILVNVADDKEYCGFLFPALVKEGKLTAGICTAGASPQTAASVRSRLAAELPGQIETILDDLNDLREIAKERIADDKSRASLLREAAKFCLAQNRPLTAEERKEWLSEYAEVGSAGKCESARELDGAGKCESTGEPDGAGKCESARELDGAGKCESTGEPDGAGKCESAREPDSGGKPGSARETDSAGKSGSVRTSGSVTLVGAGCGAYDLMTLRGLNALRNCEVLIYDDLIDSRLLDHVSESCEKIYVGKRMGAHSRGQEEINALLAKKAKEGKRVVRLKGGDPFVFGRGAEEIEALRREKIEVSEIPGITSAVAVPAAAGIPVTNREMSRSFHVVTAHTSDTIDGLPEELETLAKLGGTCVFLMGLHRLGCIAEKLLACGKSPDTPAAVVHGNFDGTVQAVRGTLADIAQKANEAGIETPAVIVVGETAGMELFS